MGDQWIENRLLEAVDGDQGLYDEIINAGYDKMLCILPTTELLLKHWIKRLFMKLRDSRKSQVYFDNYVPNRLAAIERFENTWATAPRNARHSRTLRYAIFREHLQLLGAYYSRGDTCQTIKQQFLTVVQALSKYQEEDSYELFDFTIPSPK